MVYEKIIDVGYQSVKYNFLTFSKMASHQMGHDKIEKPRCEAKFTPRLKHLENKMHLHFERTVNAKSDCTILSLTWMGKVPDEVPEDSLFQDEGWKLNRVNYYQEGWLATGNIRGIVGVTFTTSHCMNVDFPLRTNYNLRGHRSEVILVKWNEPYQKLASCDSSGIIFVWIKYEGRWSIELINDRNTPVTHFSWSHDGRMALICYQDGFVLVGSVAGQRYWSSMLNLEATITCGIWTPDDQQVYFGTTSGQIIVMDVHGAMVSQVQLSSVYGITSMAWSCEKFKMEEPDECDQEEPEAERVFILAVCLQNGFIYLLKTFDDVSPIQVDTGLQGPLCMEWSNSRELLAVAGVRFEAKNVQKLHIEFTNVLKFYTEKGVLLYSTVIPFTQSPVSALTWGHNDIRLFLATGTQIHIAWVYREIAALQLLCRLNIHAAIQHESQLPTLPLPARLRNLIGSLFAQTIRCCVPEPTALREFVARPPLGSVRLHCTMIRHDDDNNLSSGTCYTLYLEYLGGLVPLLKGKRTSKIRPEFVIFDPQVEDIHLQWSPETKSSGSGSSSHSTSGAGLITDSSESDREEGCTSSPRMQRRRKRRNKRATAAHHDKQSGQSSGDADADDLAYVDTLPEVTSNIWGTKFKIHGLAALVPSNLGQVTYKTSLLHLQPRQMTLVMTELRDDFPVVPDPNFNPNLFSEDEEEVVPNEGKKFPSRVAIDNSPPIAPMSPRGNRLSKPKLNISFIGMESTENRRNNPLPLAKAESYEDEAHADFCDTLRPQTSAQQNLRPSNSSQSTSFVGGQFTRNGSSNSQRHAISPLCCEGSVPALQSPKNAVAPSDIMFDRPPAQTLISYATDYTSNVQQVKASMERYDHQKPLIVKKIEETEKVKLETGKKKELQQTNKEKTGVDDEAAGPSTKATTTCVADSMVRSCSVGYLDMVDAQLVPSDVTLMLLRKDAPKRLVLVNRKPKSKRQSRCRHLNDNNARNKKLKNCGKSKSLDSSDLFPDLPVTSIKNHIEETIPEKSSSSSTSDNVDENSNNTNNKKEGKLGFFISRSPLMRRKKGDVDKGRRNKKNSGDNGGIEVTRTNGVPLHTQALANLEKLITRLREDDRSTPPSSPRLPRSSPASPAPSKKGKRPQSSSPIRKTILSSPLLIRRIRRSNKHQESSDDEVTASGDEIYNGTNYRDLETFQKAQLRQKLKRGKIEPNGSSCNNHSAGPQRREFVMHNKAPMWNENSQVYQLDFGGRVTQESAKNFQIEFRGKQVMQFGRIDGNAYTLDFQYPFSALQAFAVALANVTQRLK